MYWSAKVRVLVLVLFLLVATVVRPGPAPAEASKKRPVEVEALGGLQRNASRFFTRWNPTSGRLPNLRWSVTRMLNAGT